VIIDNGKIFGEALTSIFAWKTILFIAEIKNGKLSFELIYKNKLGLTLINIKLPTWIE